MAHTKFYNLLDTDRKMVRKTENEKLFFFEGYNLTAVGKVVKNNLEW